MQIKKKVQTKKAYTDNPIVIAQFNTGTEWSPGKPVTYNKTRVKVVQPDQLMARRVGDTLINWFLQENPPADRITIVPGSLERVEPVHNIWKARVQTSINLPKLGLRQHESSVRFRIVMFKDVCSIYHKHVIFPS